MDPAKISVLVVDDDPGMRQVMVRILDTAGFEVTAAENGRDAIRILKTRKFDVVITDMLMPEGDGVEVLMHLRTMKPAPAVIPISGGGQMVSASEGLALAVKMGGRAPLVKPFTAEQLVTAVRSVCGG